MGSSLSANPSRRCISRLLLSAAFLIFVRPGDALGQETFDFEQITGAQVSTQYGNRGLVLNFPALRDYSSTPGFAHSGSKAVELCFAIEFCKAQLVAKFTAGQSRVRLFAGASYAISAPTIVQMVALDQNGATIGSAQATLNPTGGIVPVSVPLEIQSPGGNIREIRVGSADPNAYNNGLVFDDLTIDVAGPQPQCTATADPTVVLSQPPAGTTVQLNQFLFQGSITTGAPLQSAILTIRGPSNQQSSTDLLGSLVQPASASFGPTNMTDSLFPGSNLVTLTARNCHGETSASTSIVYSPVGQGTPVKLLAMEISQATQDLANSVPLIRGKPTLLRLYFSTIGGPDISSVRAFVNGYKQGGYTPFLAQSIGDVTITPATDLATRRNTLTGSMNFLLSPDFYGPGLLHFWVTNLRVDGPGGAILACSGCQQWTAQFDEMPTFNLVVQPFWYLFSNRTADAGASLMNGLRYLNNVFPLKGDFPLDPSGLQVTVLPTISTGLILPRDNSRMLYELARILDDLKAQPGSGVPANAYILGIAPSGSGGVSSFNTHEAFGDSRAIENTPGSRDPEAYGSIWAQELAHAFGLRHVSDDHGEMPPTETGPEYPPHGGIGEPGAAINTLTWNGSRPFIVPIGSPASGSSHAHDFMSYGAVDGTSDHSFSWVSPTTYKKLITAMRGKLALSAVSVPATAGEKLIIGGTIAADGTVTLGPGRISATPYVKGSGTQGSLSIILADASGRELSNFHFEPSKLKDGTGAWFNEFVPWVRGTSQILVKRGDAILARRPVSVSRPSVGSVAVRNRPGDKVVVTWRAHDPDGDRLTYTLLYNSGLDRRWVPVAPELSETRATIDTSLLARSPMARIRVRASDGVNSAEADSAVLRWRANAPRPFIFDPSGRPGESHGGLVEGAALDPQDDLLAPTRLSWSSSRDGPLGTGTSIDTGRLSKGRHVITLTASNSTGVVARTRKTIIVR